MTVGSPQTSAKFCTLMKDIRKDGGANIISDFVMDNSHVEWSHFDFKGSSSILSTSHETSTESSGKDIVFSADKNNSEITLFDHSHPNGFRNPSGLNTGNGDIGILKMIQKTSPNVKAGIYVPPYAKDGFFYTQYQKYGLPIKK